MKIFRQYKYFKPPVVNATDRSKAVVLMLLYFVCLCGFYYWPFHVESCLALCSRFFFQSCLAL